ncbi:GntR family transcriptional regulator [Paenibacillus baekrokdamisoli]|uniref:GntR family transcriptional regulator n=1 Tax=Paenibacillus baekrokdamisoli TaxID=1712516 RepID=A0A3G9J6U6_9BACL|nr:GntR family transcriptional regulator [Paenibacillus baekrokdamisoli]MBB3072506.1 DNA-binding GntR family transcriptional regulator [Paenibacillus baekrokdamisoli]BBH20563.1 GntR family transcriptional regulator [Paenibacillus baekrokdamisoli]
MSEFRFEEQKNTSLRHKITDDIRKAIFQGKLKPGDRLREVEMAKQMGVSRGPIREAIRMLEQEGVINSQPYKDTMVADISVEEVEEVLLPIRLTLEIFAIRKALPNLTEQHLNNLTAIIGNMKQAADEKDLYKLVDCDLAFHEYWVTLSNVPNLLGIWTSIFNRIRLYFIVQGQTYSDLNPLWESHELLLQTIQKGNLVEINSLLTEHILDVDL